jgi:hypothetical protein
MHDLHDSGCQQRMHELNPANNMIQHPGPMHPVKHWQCPLWPTSSACQAAADHLTTLPFLRLCFVPPQHIELHRKRYGQQLNHETKKRKKEAREVHKRAEYAQKAIGLKVRAGQLSLLWSKTVAAAAAAAAAQQLHSIGMLACSSNSSSSCAALAGLSTFGSVGGD